MTAPRYLLCPGLVRSRTDGDLHHITALYRVPMDKCLVLNYGGSPGFDRRREELLARAYRGELIELGPREDGNYTMPATAKTMKTTASQQPYPDPATIDGPPHVRKNARKKAKAEMGFESDPPRCGNCRWYNSPREGHGPMEKTVVPHCRFGHFAVTCTSVCDRWQGMDGSTVEGAP